MPKNVMLVQDGAIDELMSVAMLTAMPVSDVTYVGCVVVNGDCLIAPTIQATQKILNYMATLNPDLPTDTMIFADLKSRPFNAFPWTYRQYSLMVNLLPVLNGNLLKSEHSPIIADSEQLLTFLQHHAMEDDEKLTLLALGPLTPITSLYEFVGPDYFNENYEIVWMGGAISPTPGNIDPGIAIGANPNAEWNAYWDPYAVDTLFRSSVDFTIFPLDVTNNYPLDTAFFENYIYPNKSYPMVDLAGQMYSAVAFEAGYSFWDTVTTAYIGKSDLFTTKIKKLTINTRYDDPNFGTITESDAGADIKVAQKSESTEIFYNYFIDLLKSVSG